MLSSSRDLAVGFIETSTLDITNGGAVVSMDGLIGTSDVESGLIGIGTVTVRGPGSSWTNSGTLWIGGHPNVDDGTGTLTIAEGGTVSVGIDVDVYPDGLVQLEGGTLTTSSIDFLHGGEVRLQGGTLDVGTIRFHGAEQFQQFHWLSGTLHVNNYAGTLFNDGGTLAPGRSIGATTIGGSYVQFPSAELEIEIGPFGDPQNDVVNVAFNTSLNGQLRLALIDGFVPTAQQTFTILSAGIQTGSLSGAFSNVATGQRLTTVDGLGSFRVHYGQGSAFDPKQIVLTNFLSATPGDCHIDGRVDLDDCTPFPNCMGGPGVPYDPTKCECIDLNRDGAVDLSDFADFQSAFTGP